MTLYSEMGIEDARIFQEARPDDSIFFQEAKSDGILFHNIQLVHKAFVTDWKNAEIVDVSVVKQAEE